MKNVVLYLKSRIKVIVMLVVIAIVQFVVSVSYTHLDVYKRQPVKMLVTCARTERPHGALL